MIICKKTIILAHKSTLNIICAFVLLTTSPIGIPQKLPVCTAKVFSPAIANFATNARSAPKIIILSATASINLPKSVTRLYFLAILPSKRSVSPDNAIRPIDQPRWPLTKSTAIAGISNNLIYDKKFGIVFLDPPYGEYEMMTDALDRILRMNILSENAVVICESNKKEPIEIEGLRVRRFSRYGKVYITVLTNAPEDPDEE